MQTRPDLHRSEVRCGLLHSEALLHALLVTDPMHAPAPGLLEVLREDRRRRHRASSDHLFSLEGLQQAFEPERARSCLNYRLALLRDEFAEYWRLDGDEVLPRHGRLAEVQQVCTWVHPWALAGAEWAWRLREGRLSLAALRRIARASMPYGALPGGTIGMDSPAVDLHVHLNGTLEDHWLLCEGLFSPAPRFDAPGFGARESPRIGEGQLSQRDLAAQVWALQELLWFRSRDRAGHEADAQASARRALAVLRQTLPDRAPRLQPRLLSAPPLGGRWRAEIHALLEQARRQAWIPPSPAWRGAADGEGHQPKAAAALMLWFTALHLIVEVAPDSGDAWLARVALHTVHRWRAMMVMGEGRGLARFVQFFGSEARKPRAMSEDTYVAVVLDGLEKGGASGAEIKISPDAVTTERLAKALRRGLHPPVANKAQGLRPEVTASRRRHAVTEQQPLRWGVHFLKGADRTRLPATRRRGMLPARHDALRRSLRDEEHRLYRYLFTPVGRRVPAWRIWGPMATRGLAQALVDLGGLVQHLDAAGLETLAPVEVFAPVILALRNSRNPEAGLPGWGQRKQLGISVHAGEYFRHLVSGMRAVDEAISYLELGEGDRLGHALAIGVEPLHWLQACGGQCVLPVLERLDNLVWLRQRMLKLLKEGHGENAGCETLMPVITQEIRRWSLQVYGESVDPHALWLAWSLRSRDPLLSRKPMRAPLSPLRAAGGELTTQDEVVARRLWRRYHHDPGVRRAGDELHRWELAPRQWPAWAALWRAVQVDVLRDVVREGIVIEANVSSNLRTAGAWFGPGRGLAGHPVFRWKPLQPNREPQPLLTLGSDDPGIFLTSIGREYALLREAASGLEATPADVQHWLSDLRQQGVYQFGHRAQWPQALQAALMGMG